MKQTPFWVEEHPRPEDITSDLPAESDVLVVGSGLTGLSAALRLARGGRSVSVVDAGDIASGASSVNGGMVSPDIKAGIKLIFDRHGPELGGEMWRATMRSVDIVSDLAAAESIDAGIVRGGMAALGIGERAQRAFERTLAWYEENVGVEWEVLGPERVGEVVGESRFTTALFEPEGMGIQPARFVFGLAERAARAGAVLVADCEVISFQREGPGFRVETTAGQARAGHLVLATNGYTTTRPSPELARRVVPVGSYIIVTEPIGDRAAAVFPGGAMTYTKKRLLNYMRRTPDDRILIGGRRNLHTGLDLEQSAEALYGQLVGYFPHLDGVAISHVWGGKLGVPFDLVPHMGQVEGAWYALGYAGHGVGLSTLMGHELGGMLLGEEPPSVFTKVPHPTRFYYRGRPWFLTPASLLYRALDRLGR
ncbi:MAG TPA: FAD-dependent oxidoreductase [Acidimicrobiia bacterium]|nr:FAD-dependent oxidoreductase [Acidimicrobiia bacterium]